MNRTVLSSLLAITLYACGIDAATFLVGQARAFKTPSDVAGTVGNGDTVLIDTGTYTGQACTWSANNLTLRGAARYAHLIPPNPVPNEKAIWIIDGQNTTVENIEFSDASISDADGGNGAGIRQEGVNLIVRHCYFHDCQDGILESNIAASNITMEYSEFARCGNATGPNSGYTHNIYIGHCASLTMRFCYSHDALVGHTLKSRAHTNYIFCNRIMSLNSTTSYEASFPNGGTAFLIGNCVEQGPNSQNSVIIDYGSEGLSGYDSSFYVVNNTVVNDLGSGTFVRIANTSQAARVINNLFSGPGTPYSGPVDTTANIFTTAPGFVDKANFDYHLTATSPAVDKGVNPGAVGSLSLAPDSQYVYDLNGSPRSIVGAAIDVGAFEYSPLSVVSPQAPILQMSSNRRAYRLGFHPRLDMMGRLISGNQQKAGARTSAFMIGPDLP